MSIPFLADKRNCTGCLVCADSCAQNAITTAIDNEGQYTYKVDGEKCILCHRCEKVCPIVSGKKYGNNELKKSIPFAAWVEDEALRATATSGGVFAGLAKRIIEQGGVAFGALQEQYYVHHEAVETVNMIFKLQGSKYTQSRTEGIFRQVKTTLNNGRKVLFSGLGCQVAALLSFLDNDKHLDNLVTVDLICGGVPSSFLIKKYVEQFNKEFESIAAYRKKSDYVFSVFDKDGTQRVIPLCERPLPLCGSYTKATERYVCYNCPFAFGHRNSDITIGDYWGNRLYQEQESKGVSVAVVHTAKGLKALQNSSIEIYEIGWRDFLPSNPRLVCGLGYISHDRKRMAKAFNIMSYRRILEVYANKGTLSRPWTILAKVRRFVIAKLLSKKRQMIIENILKENLL